MWILGSVILIIALNGCIEEKNTLPDDVYEVVETEFGNIYCAENLGMYCYFADGNSLQAHIDYNRNAGIDACSFCVNFLINNMVVS